MDIAVFEVFEHRVETVGVAAADGAMYGAKERGKNCIFVATPLPRKTLISDRAGTARSRPNSEKGSKVDR